MCTRISSLVRGIRGVPLWFDEGVAEAIGYLAITQIGVLDQDDIYELTSYLLTAYPVMGGLEQFAPYGSLTTEAYPLSYIAVQYLLGRSGLSVSALGDFYRAVASGSSVDDAFRSTFGISLDEYYVEFNAWRISSAHRVRLSARLFAATRTRSPGDRELDAPATGDRPGRSALRCGNDDSGSELLARSCSFPLESSSGTPLPMAMAKRSGW